MADRTSRQSTTITRRTAMQAGTAAVLASGVPMFVAGEALADKAKIDAILGGAVSATGVPGVVALAADDKGVIYEGAFGKRDLVTGPPMTLDTMFWIASMTKAVTSVAAMQLVEQGKLQLDQPIGDVVPSSPRPRCSKDFDASGAPQLRPAEAADHPAPSADPHGRLRYDLWNADIARYMKTPTSRRPAPARTRP